MLDIEREAFWRGYRDCTTAALRKHLHIGTVSGMLDTPFWRPPEGHEDAYAAGWEKARLQILEEGKARKAA